MNRKFSRREFLGLAFGAPLLAPLPVFGVRPRRTAFNLLIIGDSVIWGQGLEEEQKFYWLTKDWIERDVLKGSLPVELKVFAHSGSTVKLDPMERAALESANRTGYERLHPEVNVSFPTIEKQVRSAAAAYPDPELVDLIMVSGGIPDVGVAKIINPFESNDRLMERIDGYCRVHMKEVLGEASVRFPNANFAVVGYYPIITRYTPMKRIVNDILELYNWPLWSKPIVNNPVNRSVFRLWKGKMIKRSKIWFQGSSSAFNEVVDSLNASSGRKRAVFVPSPIGERQAFGTRDSMLFTVARRGRPADPKGATRLRECGPALQELRDDTRLRYRTRFCELASVGHPNPKGSAAIALSIQQTLRQMISS
ncbi:MAG TPA: hypothetical protein PKD26_10855 [Pyrinomonadaceae bacterium]|nr:hypothetical protein [Pyrinomonadaceae bacterium]